MFSKEWLREDDTDFFEIEKRRENEVVADLKAQLSLKRKESHDVSNRAASVKSKPKRNIKASSRAFSEKFKSPLIFGRGSQKSVLLNIGTVMPGHQFRTEYFIYPIGYKIRRRFLNFHSDEESLRDQKTYYQCSITTDDQNMPLVSYSLLLLL